MNLDEELRGTLLARAEEAPEGAGMLDSIRTRARRRDLRTRMALAGGGVALAVALVVGTPFLLSPFRSGDTPAGPTASGTTDRGPGPTLSQPPPVSPRQSTVALTGTFQPMAFPLSPEWTPPGVGTPTVGRNEEELRLIYSEQPATLMATIGAQLTPPDWQPVTTEATTVGGRGATMTTGRNSEGKPAVRITWRLADQRWVDLQSGGALSSTQVKRYADNLRSQPFTVPPPFTLAVVPQGFQVIFQEIHPELTPDEFYFCLAPPTAANDNEAWLCMNRRADSSQSTGGEPVQVGSHPGEITREDGRIILAVHPPGFDFAVTESGNGPLSEEDLIRFAAGVAKR